MTTLQGSHKVTEIEGVRCSVAGTGLSEERKEFLAGILRSNGLEVKAELEKAKDGTPLGTWVLGVTDILFNPVIRVYQRKMFRPDGHLLTPAYWEQWPADPDITYWQVVR